MRTLLFTGSSGFLGTNLLDILSSNYRILTLGLGVDDDIHCDLSMTAPKLNIESHIVLHAAGKAHSVPKTEVEKQSFYDVNLQGTKNLCAALEQVGVPKAFIFISTVAVYGLENGENIDEKATLNGKTPYALSKIMAEQFLAEWCKLNNVILSIIRPSLIAGPNPPGNLGSMISGIKSGRYLSIAGGKARKSVLMVEDIANLIPLLVDKGGIYNVCATNHPSFRELESVICNQLGKNLPISLPFWAAKLIAKLGDLFGAKAPINTDKLNKIVMSLTFSNVKARSELNWEPLDVLENFKIK